MGGPGDADGGISETQARRRARRRRRQDLRGRRGFPRLGDEAPGHQNRNNQIRKFIDGGGKNHACRFPLQAPYGHGEPSLMAAIRPISPLDVLDCMLLHKRDNAFFIDSWRCDALGARGAPM